MKKRLLNALGDWLRVPQGMILPPDVASEETRKQRRFLLVVCTLGLTYEWLGVEPKQIALFGVTVGIRDRRALDVVLVLMILYGLVSLVIYASSDFASAFREMHGARKSEFESQAYEELFPEAIRHDPEKEILADTARWFGMKEFGRFLVGALCLASMDL